MINGLVSIIIVNWNQRDITLDCLRSLKKATYPKIEIIVVDNGSTDGSVEAISKEFPEVIFIRNRENLGFAKPNNMGFKKAKGDFILLLNNDTKITPNLITKLVSVLESNHDIGVVQPKIYMMDFPGRNDLVGTYLTPTGFVYYFGYWKKDAPKYLKRRNIFFAKGAAMMTKREVIKKVGLFDNDFVTYFEEYDFCWRVWLAGYRVVYEPSAIVYHKVAFTSRNLEKRYTIELTFRNRIATLIKNLSWPYLIWLLPVHLGICLGLIFYYLLIDYHLSIAVLIAIFWNIKNLEVNLIKRKKVQTLIRKKDDREVFRDNLLFVPVSYYRYLVGKAWLFEDPEI